MPILNPTNQATQLFSRRRKTRWGSIGFLASITLLTVVALPLYIIHFGVSPAEWALFAFYVLATSFSITVGYHRFFSHSTFKANVVVRFLALFFGAAAFEQSALKWSSQHRWHHQFVDTERDPYNIRYGFWYAHVGWILTWKQPISYENVKDLQKSRLVMHQHEYYLLWSLVSGVAVPILIGGFLGHWLGAALLAVSVRLFIVFNSAFFINSFAHTFGSMNYDANSTAKDHWLGAVLTNGEGYHNFHHRFPNDYRNGIRWFHWDPSKWLIWTLKQAGWTWDLRQTPALSILSARRDTAAIHAATLVPSI